MKLIENHQQQQQQQQTTLNCNCSILQLISLYHLPGPLDTICGDGMCTGRFQHLRLDDDSMPAAVRGSPLSIMLNFHVCKN